MAAAYLQRSSTRHFQDAINFVNFNQDFTCISVGTKNGYNLFNCDPFGKCFAKVDGGIGIVEMLFCTSLVAVVGVGDQPHLSPRRLKIVNTKRKLTICELTFPTAVLKVHLNRKRLIVLLEEQIYIYDISNMQLLYTIETSPNPQAICALSPSSENCYLAYPSPAPQSSSPFAFPPHVPAANNLTSPNRTGDVVVFDTLTLQPVNVIEAHKSPLSAISFNNDGNLLATASDKGTIVRVFSIPSATKLYQFRRGTYPSKIFSINFNLASSLLAVSSATETIHIFRLARPGNIQTVGYHRRSNSRSLQPSNESNSTGNSTGSLDTTKSKSTTASGAAAPNGDSSTENDQPDNNNDTNSDSNNPEGTNGNSQTFTHNDASTTSLDSASSSSASSILPQLTNREDSVNSAGLDSATDSKKWRSVASNPATSATPSAPNTNTGGSSMASILRRGSRSLGRQVAGAMGTYLPSAVTEMWEPQRDFAFVKLPGSAGLKSVVSFNAQSTRLFVVTSEGYFYQYAIDHSKGGEGQLLQQYSLLDNSEE